MVCSFYIDCILTWWNRWKLWFPGIFLRIQGRNGHKFGMLMYPDHFQKWLYLSYGLLIFLILVAFWLLGETGHISGFFVKNVWEEWPVIFCMLMCPDHLQNWLDHCCRLLIFHIFMAFWLSEMGQIWGFLAFSKENMERMAWNLACWCFLTTFRTD